jgi:hypothetical protein
MANSNSSDSDNSSSSSKSLFSRLVYFTAAFSHRLKSTVDPQQRQQGRWPPSGAQLLAEVERVSGAIGGGGCL